MKATYAYRQNRGVIPFIIKLATAAMLAIVLVRTMNSSTNNLIIVILCSVYFVFSVMQFVKGIKNRPLTLKIDNKGIEYTSTVQTISSLWKDVLSVNEYYVPGPRGAGYFRIDLKLKNGGIIWFTNNILLSEKPKRESANYLEVKNFISQKVPKDRIKFQVTE